MAFNRVLVASAFLLLLIIIHRTSSLSANSPSWRHRTFVEPHMTQGPPTDTLLRHHKHKNRPYLHATTHKYDEHPVDTPVNVSPADYRHNRNKLYRSVDLLETSQIDTTTTTSSSPRLLSSAITASGSYTLRGKLPSSDNRTFNVTHAKKDRRNTATRRSTRPTTTSTELTTKFTTVPPRSFRLRHQKDSLWSDTTTEAGNQLLWSEYLFWSELDADVTSSEDEDDNYNPDIRFPAAKKTSSNSNQLHTRSNDKSHSKSNQSVGSLKTNLKLRNGGHRRYEEDDWEHVSSRPHLVS